MTNGGQFENEKNKRGVGVRPGGKAEINRANVVPHANGNGDALGAVIREAKVWRAIKEPGERASRRGKCRPPFER